MYSYDRRPGVRTGNIGGGPVGRALEKHWNQIHDAEYDLDHSWKDYDHAASFSGGPARHDAQEMIKKIQAAHKELEHVTMKTFSDLVDAEAAFIKKYGEPSDYVREQQQKTFPR